MHHNYLQLAGSAVSPKFNPVFVPLITVGFLQSNVSCDEFLDLPLCHCIASYGF